MKIIIPLLLFSVILIYGCERDYISTGYPTTYVKYPKDIVSQKIAGYMSRNRHMRTTLNEYGFCQMRGYQDYIEPPFRGTVSKDEAINLIRNFISENSPETGVRNVSDINFPNPSTSTSSNGCVLWHFRSLNQKFDTIEVLNSSIMIHLINGEVYNCYGNWCPEIYLPPKYNFDPNMAKESLIGLVVSHYSFAGQEYRKTISRDDLNDCTVRLKVYPMEDDDKIKLWICWQIYVPAAEYIFYIDVVSGNIIRKETTIISVIDPNTGQ